LEENYVTKDGFVSYLDFCDEVESVFTKKGLEKTPLETPQTFDVYSNGWETDAFLNELLPEDEKILKAVMKRLNSRVSERRIDALSYMEDYDFVKEGNE
jgi:hypothetical protein